MEERENRVREWFSMWLRQDCTGLETLFCPEAVYVESWGPEYHGADQIRLWFEEWNRRGIVLKWEIRQFFHKGEQTAVEWLFLFSGGLTAASGGIAASLIVGVLAALVGKSKDQN